MNEANRNTAAHREGKCGAARANPNVKPVLITGSVAVLSTSGEGVHPSRGNTQRRFPEVLGLMDQGPLGVIAAALIRWPASNLEGSPPPNGQRPERSRHGWGPAGPWVARRAGR